MKAIIYARVSTQEQAASGLGIAAQVERCRAFAEYRGHDVIDTITENGVSGAKAPADREGMGRALAMLAGGDADMLIAAKLDRVGRDVRDLLDLVARADREGWALALLDLDLDTSTAGGKLVLTIFAGVAAWERDVIAERTRAALAAKKAQGARLGRPVEVSREAQDRARQLLDSGASMAATAKTLNAEGVPTARGGKWHASTVASLRRSWALDAAAEAAR